MWFDDLRAESIGDRLNIVFEHDVILCGWLGSKYQPTDFRTAGLLGTLISLSVAGVWSMIFFLRLPRRAVTVLVVAVVCSPCLQCVV